MGRGRRGEVRSRGVEKATAQCHWIGRARGQLLAGSGRGDGRAGYGRRPGSVDDVSWGAEAVCAGVVGEHNRGAVAFHTSTSLTTIEVC